MNGLEDAFGELIHVYVRLNQSDEPIKAQELYSNL